MDAGKALINPQKIIDQLGLKKGMRVADMGCGRTGHFIFIISKTVGETGMVYAVDIMKDILESIRSRVRSEGYDNIQAVWSDIEKVGKTPIPARTLDVCLFINVMFMLKDKASALREAQSLLNNGGKVVVVDWRKKLGPLGPTPDLMTSPREIIELAKREGLALVSDFPAGDYHYCLIFEK